MALPFFICFNWKSSVTFTYHMCRLVDATSQPRTIRQRVLQVKYYSRGITYPKNTPSINMLLRLLVPKCLIKKRGGRNASFQATALH
jgi:hypothetical protein